MHKSAAPWLIEGLLPAGVVTGLIGAPLSGKSSLAFHLARAVGTGNGFAGRALNGGPKQVLWISAEDGWAEEMQQRGERGWEWLDVVPDEAVDLLMVTDGDRFEFVKWWDRLADDMVAAGDYGLVVVDHLLGFTTSRSSEGIDRPQSIGPFMTALGQLARQTGCAVVLIHHENKSGGAMGSVNFGVRTRETITVKRNKRTGSATVYVEGNRISPYRITFNVLKPTICELGSIPDTDALSVAKGANPKEDVSKSGRQKAALVEALRNAPDDMTQRATVQWLRTERGFSESESTLLRRLRSL